MTDPDTAGTDGTDSTGGGDETDRPAADDAFAALGSATRLRVLRTLAAADEPPTFTDLFEATDEETSAGFAYHLRQLVDRYVRKDPETDRYHLTYAGRQAARALAAGTYTERVDREPEPVEGNCPVCEEPGLEARIADNVVGVACTACGTDLLSLPFPPSGSRDRDGAETLDAFESYHRSRLRLLAEGVCPDCAGRAGAGIEFVEAHDLPGDEPRPVLAGRCADCDFRVRTPVSVALADHPDVVAFFRAHGASVRDRPLWNLGPEWGETVLSTDPAAVRVSVGLEDEELRLLVGDGPTVADVERLEDSPGDVDSSRTGPDDTLAEAADAQSRAPDAESQSHDSQSRPRDAQSRPGDEADETERAT